MIDQKFITEHANNLIELRDIDEIKLYCKANGFEIKDQEIENLRTSMQALVNKTPDSQLLKLEDLSNVSGGMSETGQMLLAVAVMVVGVGIGLALHVKAAGGFSKAFLGGGIGKALSASATPVMLGMAGFDTTLQLTEGIVEQPQAEAYQQKYAEEYAESAHGNNQCG